MNEKGKSNAEFLVSKKPITAFNNIMMNLHSDQQGYKTNLYSTYNQAKESGMSVKRSKLASIQLDQMGIPACHEP